MLAMGDDTMQFFRILCSTCLSFGAVACFQGALCDASYGYSGARKNITRVVVDRINEDEKNDIDDTSSADTTNTNNDSSENSENMDQNPNNNPLFPQNAQRSSLEKTVQINFQIKESKERTERNKAKKILRASSLSSSGKNGILAERQSIQSTTSSIVLEQLPEIFENKNLLGTKEPGIKKAGTYIRTSSSSPNGGYNIELGY